MGKMNEQEARKVLAGIVQDMTGYAVDPALPEQTELKDIPTTSTAVFVDMDSLERVEMLMCIEESFGLEFIDDAVAEKWTTLGDVLAYLRDHDKIERAAPGSVV